MQNVGKCCIIKWGDKMKSIWCDINKSAKMCPDETDLDDFVLENMSEGTFDEYESPRNTPESWAEIIGLCKSETTPERLETLFGMMSRTRAAEFSEFYSGFKKNLLEFVLILDELESGKINEFYTENKSECERVFALLCENGFAESGDKSEIFRYNLAALSGLISANDFFDKIKPLVYFQTLVNHKKKMLSRSGFSPNFKKLFNRKDYLIDEDNGKSYKQFAEYCDLYVRLKSCFPNVDSGLCDMGFLYCSNLADWYHSLGWRGYECDIPDGIPFTIEAAVREMFVTCFDEPSGNCEMLEKWRRKYSTLHEKAESAVECIRFEDLREFSESRAKFCERFFTGEFMEYVNVENHDAAWGLLIRAAELRFDELLEEEIIGILYDYLRV